MVILSAKTGIFNGFYYKNMSKTLTSEMYVLKHSLVCLPVYKRRLTAEQTPFGDSTAVAFIYTGFA